ncbi:MAG: hypothetical protein DMD97_07875 [Candidatus Rokuibacteriota bacterium]|nr:MAG: hypothetical protein DMD97_07875 [Candidatus Rokubacteria bacterium]
MFMRKVELSPLTGIRFYAALPVYLAHVTLIPGMEGLTGGSLFLNVGIGCVSFFFVLSGFILTYNYADVFRDGISLDSYKRFVWDRLTKIYPVHFLALLIALPISILSPNLPLDWRAVGFHLLLLQCFWPSSTPAMWKYLNVPSWSISCEWFFYLLAPMAMFFALGKGRRWIPVCVVIGYAGGLGLFLWQGQSDYTRLYFVFWFAPSRFVEFLAGVLLAKLFLSPARPKLAGVSGPAQAVGIALIIVAALFREHAPWPLAGGLLYVPGAVLLVLGLAYGRGFFAAHLSRPLLNRLGMATFSLYLVHMPVLRALKGVCLYSGWAIRSWPAAWGVVIAVFALVQAAALLIYDRYELPLQRRFRKLGIDPLAGPFPKGRAAAADFLPRSATVEPDVARRS